jgi:hypothetical protein
VSCQSSLHLDSRLSGGIHRRDLRALAQELSTPEKRRAAFVATLPWGAGETNRYYGRHAKALSSERLPSILEETGEADRSQRLAGALPTAARLPGMGFRFFTEWIWVSG